MKAGVWFDEGAVDLKAIQESPRFQGKVGQVYCTETPSKQIIRQGFTWWTIYISFLGFQCGAVLFGRYFLNEAMYVLFLQLALLAIHLKEPCSFLFNSVRNPVRNYLSRNRCRPCDNCHNRM